MKTKEKANLIHSIKVKIILVVFLAIVVSTGMNLWTVIPLMESNMRETIQHYMKDVTLIAGQDLDREVSAVGLETVLTPEQLAAAVGGIKIKEMDSSYAYVVSADGTMLYHPTAEKIGLPVENQAVTSLVAEIGKGNKPETDVIVYEFNGAIKYAAFYISSNSDYILVITADEDEVFTDMNRIIKRCSESAGITVVLCTIVALIIAIRIVKPIEKITAIVGKISDFDFREDEKQAAISRKKMNAA